MQFTKCPRCDLNYILDGQLLCAVCREEVRGGRGSDEAPAPCSVCGELPALPGEDMCRSCLAEIQFLVASPSNEPDSSAEPDFEPVSHLEERETPEPAGDAPDGQDASPRESGLPGRA